jgi:hypothetical protein
MSFSAAAAGNFQFFLSIGGGGWEISIFFSLSAAAAAENFPEFFEKISSFREISA